MLQAPHAKRFTFWAVLGAGILAGAAAASGHATSPPGVHSTRTTAGLASVAPDAALRDQSVAAMPTATPASTSETGDPVRSALHPEPAQKALTPTLPSPAPGEEPLVFLDSPSRGPQGAQVEASEASKAVEAADPIAANGPRFTLLLMLVFGILGVGAIVVHFLKKGRGTTGALGPRLELVDSLRIAGKWHISLVRAPGRLLVIGASDGEVSLLADLDEDEDPATILADTMVDLPAARPQTAVKPPVTAASIEEHARGESPTAEEDPFFDALLTKMNARQPAFAGSSQLTAPAAIDAPTDEMAAIRARIAAYEQRTAQSA